MSRYYAGAKPFIWLRKKFKIEKPYALEWGGWDKWDSATKKEKPIGYFMCETLPDLLQLPAEYTIDPLNDVRYYFVNRFIDESHKLRTGLAPGGYHTLGDRLLHGAFSELVDLVEIDIARKSFWCGSGEDGVNIYDKYKVPFWARHYMLRWGSYRNAEAGIDYLKWEAELDKDSPVEEAGWHDRQAASAREKMRLYFWWKEQRPARPTDSWEASGLRPFWDSMEEKYKNAGGTERSGWLLRDDVITADEEAEYSRLSDMSRQLERDWENEDSTMLMALVNIREELDT